MNTIQETELRIGNFIGMNLEEYPNNFFTALEIGETMKVYEGLITLKGANIKRVETSFMYVDDFEPIPLTEDWLVRLGFHKDNYGLFVYVKDNAEYKSGCEILLWVKFIENGILEIAYGDEFDNLKEIAKAKHVHTLQNLIFALEGTELTLTDK